MIQFNLLPDVKLEYIKAQRSKRLFVSVSILASIVTFTIFVLLFLVVNVVQEKNLKDLNADIKAQTAQIQNTPNVNKILTIQSQLGALNGLHDQKPVASNMIKYLGQLTPANVTISNAATDFEAKTMTVTGNAPSLDAVNTYIDTLKFTTFTTDKNSDQAKAFSEVVLSAFSRTASTSTYTVTFKYDPLIYDATAATTLTVPKTVTTRSVTESPANLFTNGGGAR